MANAGGNTDMFTNRSSIGEEDIESVSITEQVNNSERKALSIESTIEKMEERDNNDGHVEDIDKWVASLESILNDVPQYMCNRGHPGRISRIPQNLREIDVKGYEPYILSIGPYHYGKARVQWMEMRKRLALKRVLEYNPEVSLKLLLKEILSIEPVARSFYSHVEMECENFVQMLVLDSVCIVDMFCGMRKSRERMNELNTRIESSVGNGDMNEREREINEENQTTSTNENSNLVISDDGMNVGENLYWVMFAHDLFLIENQIPFFILEIIYSLIYSDSEIQLVDIMKYEVGNLLIGYTKKDSNNIVLESEKVHHILHLCHMFFRPTIERVSISSHFPESSQMFRLGSAVQLYEAGVHFEVKSGSTEYSLLDITFDSSGKMAMPCLVVDDNTESLLRNLIALEQMKYPSLGLNISAYIVLLLHLITIPKDVELLRRKGIIEHHLASDKEMMYLVNRLSVGLALDYVEDKYSLKHVFHQLKHYSERRVPRWRAWLKHRHFSNPWTTITLLVASLLLLLTIVQTYYAVYSYYYPRFNAH